MKKILFLLLTLPLFLACSSDDKEELNNDDTKEIEGSKWRNDDSEFKNDILTLNSNGKGFYSYDTTSSKPESFNFEITWEYRKPKIVIKFKDGRNYDNGYIEGNKMYLGQTTGRLKLYTRY